MAAYKRTVRPLAFVSLAVGIILLCLGAALSSKSIGPRMALLVSPDGYITPDGLEDLKIAGARCRFLGLLALSCGIVLLATCVVLPRFAVRFSKLSIGRKLMDAALGIRWDWVLGAIGITHLCVMLVVGIIHAPFSIDGPLRFDGARHLLNTGNPVPHDAGGSPIEARKGVSLSCYVLALFCVAVGGGLICAKALYALFSLLCILGLGYVTHKAFGKGTAGFAIFVASMVPFVHQVAVDSARVEFLATILLFLGIVMLYQPTYRSRWNSILGCLLIGLSTRVKFTLVVLMPAFVITGLLSGTRERWRDRALSITLGPIVGMAAFYVLNLMYKCVLFGGRATLYKLASYWLTSNVHGTLGSTGGVSLAYKLSAINGMIALPIFAVIIVAAGLLLVKEKFGSPLRLFVFLAAIGWIAWWLIFDSSGLIRHLLVGFLFFCILMGGFSAEVVRGLRRLIEGGKAAFLNESSILWPRAYVSLAAVLVMTFIALGTTSVVGDLAWLKWASPMRKGQERLAEYVAVNKEQIVFCSWGQISAYDISALSQVPFWDISQGLPPDSLRRDRRVQIIVTAWQKKEFASGFEGGLFPGERDLIDSRCRLVRSIGENDVYELIAGTGN